MGKRSYRQNCALAQAADVIGERWTLLLVRDLLVGPRRFRDLQRSLKGAGSNLLSERLRELESAGIIERRGNGVHHYALTPVGAALEPAVLALVRWGLAHGPRNRPGYHHHDDWDLVALKALFQPNRAGDMHVTVQFDSDALTGWMTIDAGVVTIGLGRAEAADLVIAATVAELFTGKAPPDSLLRSGKLDVLKRFMTVFALRP